MRKKEYLKSRSLRSGEYHELINNKIKTNKRIINLKN